MLWIFVADFRFFKYAFRALRREQGSDEEEKKKKKKKKKKKEDALVPANLTLDLCGRGLSLLFKLLWTGGLGLCDLRIRWLLGDNPNGSRELLSLSGRASFSALRRRARAILLCRGLDLNLLLQTDSQLLILIIIQWIHDRDPVREVIVILRVKEHLLLRPRSVGRGGDHLAVQFKKMRDPHYYSTHILLRIVHDTEAIRLASFLLRRQDPAVMEVKRDQKRGLL